MLLYAQLSKRSTSHSVTELIFTTLRTVLSFTPFTSSVSSHLASKSSKIAWYRRTNYCHSIPPISVSNYPNKTCFIIDEYNESFISQVFIKVSFRYTRNIVIYLTINDASKVLNNAAINNVTVAISNLKMAFSGSELMSKNNILLAVEQSKANCTCLTDNVNTFEFIRTGSFDVPKYTFV